LSLLLFFYDAFVAADVLFANIMFPFAYPVDYLPKIVLEFFVGQIAGALNFIHDIIFTSARSYRNQKVIPSHIWSDSILG